MIALATLSASVVGFATIRLLRPHLRLREALTTLLQAIIGPLGSWGQLSLTSQVQAGALFGCFFLWMIRPKSTFLAILSWLSFVFWILLWSPLI